MKPVRFITLEGGEGVGKTTNLQFIEQWLQQKDISVVTTREPGGTALSENIRSLLLQQQASPVAAETELLLIFAARAQHIAEVIRPSLDQGSWVLCDRFTDASYAYQGSGRDISEEKIEFLEQWVQGDFRPDLTLLLDAPVSLGMSRARSRGNLDRFETEDTAFFERVRQGYLVRAQRYPERIKIIDAQCSLESIQSELVCQLEVMIASC